MVLPYVRLKPKFVRLLVQWHPHPTPFVLTDDIPQRDKADGDNGGNSLLS